MGYRGHVKGGVVVLDQPTSLPEGAEVEAEAVEEEGRSKPSELFEHCRDVIGMAKGLPPDAAVNHDHYLYGMPKR